MQVTGFRSQASGFRLQVTSNSVNRFQVSGFRFQVTTRKKTNGTNKLQVTSLRSQASGFRSQQKKNINGTNKAIRQLGYKTIG